MPWLHKDKLFFVHVPRCAGTSMTKHHKVREKAREGKNLYHKSGLIYFFYRYDLLEEANFPWVSIENGIVILQLIIGLLLYYFDNPGAYPSWIIMWTFGSTTFILSTFVGSAPAIGRSRFLRRAYQLCLGSWASDWMASKEIVTGCGEYGWLLHFTAEKVYRYGLVKESDLREKSFAIVRNPYSRMVSIYMYNKIYFESFEQFCIRFYREYEVFRNTGSTDDWDVYCHSLPMHAYTHNGTKQIVPTIVKQEDLKKLWAPIPGRSNRPKPGAVIVPEDVMGALTGLPHANSRARDKPWQDYYTQTSMELVLKMYGWDFVIFGYETTIPGRPDLHPNEVIYRKVNSKGEDVEEQLLDPRSNNNILNEDSKVMSPDLTNNEPKAQNGSN